ncbi:PIN domain-like protein [Pisolithus tinctorius]|nr:PIN domain-like protein [Pisolithus tinctorius]
MRQKRAKTYRKLMSLYCMSFGFREPYQVLESRIDLSKQLSTVLQGVTKPSMAPDHAMLYTRTLSQGKSQQSACRPCKIFERRKCNHREAIPGDDCLASVPRSRSPFAPKLRLIPGVPIIHINREETLRVKQQKEQEALGPAAAESVKLPQQPSNPPRKKKGPKGPNPLSMKKKVARPASVRIPRQSDSTAPPSPSDLSIGEKRKREENDEQLAATRKRRRRRKHGSGPTSSVATTA